jgi:DNA invertase Pin-like site-specific DNA recombinase
MQQAVGYVRASTQEQDLSPEAQAVALRGWCEASGATLAAVFHDLGISGATPIDRRPGFLEALGSAKQYGAEILLIAKRDRLARDVIIAATAEQLARKAGLRIVAANGAGNGDDASAWLLRTILDAMAQYERALIRQRTKAALAVKKAKGEQTGTIPYGYQLAADGKTLLESPDEQAVLARIRTLRDRGYSMQRIADALNADGWLTRRGTPWRQQYIDALLKKAA